MIFGKPALSIKNVPHWKEVLKFLGESIDVHYEVVIAQHVFKEIYGDSTVLAARDKTHVTMLVPSVLNTNATFQDFTFLTLDSLNTGYSPEVKGVVVGQLATCVNRLFVDAFVNCLNKVYTIPWDSTKVRVHKDRSFPMFLVSDQFTFIISPLTLQRPPEWSTQKYRM